ncbi:MAG: hypothetical protein V7609_2135 [Verrucomicrobiota bacterium]
MEIFLWLAINSIVGAAIGARKNMVGGAIALAIFLGPIGWIIALVMEGDFRKCPFCAENVKDAAIVCPHCHRDLPPKITQPLSPARDRALRIFAWCAAGFIVIGFGGTIIYQFIQQRSARIDVDRRSEELRSVYNNSDTPAPSPPPEFVRLTTDYTFYDQTTGREIKTVDPGTKLRVVARYQHDLTISFREHEYSLPAAITEPAK